MEETTPEAPSALPAAGWYADPLDDRQDRWWTGAGWSEHTRERLPVTPAQPYAQPTQPAYAQPAEPAYSEPAYSQPTYSQPTQPTYAQPAYPATTTYTPMSYSAPQPQFAYSNPGSEPLVGASLGQAFVRFWTKYAVFTGRASRSEYWWWTLTFVIVYVAAIVLEAVLERGSVAYLAVSIIFLVYVLASIVPSYAILVRRLHDANLSGWNYFWSWLPLAGGIVLLVFLLRGSDPAGRQYDAY